MLMTPPRTDSIESRTGFAAVGAESPSKGKGKQREGEAGSISQWQKIQADENNPFHERAASLRGLGLSSSTSTPLATPIRPQLSLPITTATPESIKSLLSDLSTTLPSYVAKLERKQVAAEKSNEAKVKKIEELEKENGMYVICPISLPK